MGCREVGPIGAGGGVCARAFAGAAVVVARAETTFGRVVADGADEVADSRYRDVDGLEQVAPADRIALERDAVGVHVAVAVLDDEPRLPVGAGHAHGQQGAQSQQQRREDFAGNAGLPAWQDPRGGTLTPNPSFIPTAEGSSPHAPAVQRVEAHLRHSDHASTSSGRTAPGRSRAAWVGEGPSLPKAWRIGKS